MHSNAKPMDSDYDQSLHTYWNLTQTKFYASDRCRNARKMLQELVDSPDYETLIDCLGVELSFKERHLDYLSKHPHIDLTGYMSNLRLMTRKRKIYKG